MALSVSSLKDEVREQLRNKIVTCQLEPGSRIVETEVARSYGISQVPIREAIRSLEAEGLIKSIKNKGSFVTEIDETEIYYMHKLRSSIETSVLELIWPLHNDQFEILTDIIEKMKTISNDSNYNQQSKLDVTFHSKIIEWARIDTYLRVWNMLTGHIQRFIAFKHPKHYEDHAKVIHLHESLLEIWRSGSLQEAKEATTAHTMLLWIEGKEKIPNKK